jgi:AcrR family transcriptional regulator
VTTHSQSRSRRPAVQGRSLRTRAAILTAAARLFSTRGYTETGTRDIAAAAGVNQALIAYHFGGKGELYDEILAEGVAEAKRLAAEADIIGDRFPERRLVFVFAEALSSRPHLAPMILREQLSPDRLLNPKSTETMLGFMELTEAVLASLPLDAEARGWDPQIVHLAVVGPLISYLVATRIRESVVGKLDRSLSTPDLETFATTLGQMLSRALRRGSAG